MQKTNEKEFRIEKVIKRKRDQIYFKWKGYDNSFNSWTDKKDLLWFYLMQFHCIKMTQYIWKPYEAFGGGINVKVDLSNYVTKSDITNIIDVDTSSFALKTNLASLKTEFDKLDIDKLVPIPVDLSKLCDAVKNDVVKKTKYDELVAKVDNIDTIGFVLRTKFDTDKSELENKIPDTSGLVKNTDCDCKIAEIEGKIPDVSNLATKTALTVF